MTVGGQVTLYLVLLELPAIVFGLIVFRKLSDDLNGGSTPYGSILHEAFTNRGVILLIGGVIIGWLFGPSNRASVTGLYTSAFKGLLALFLLEMGLMASAALLKVSWDKVRILIYALSAPRYWL